MISMSLVITFDQFFFIGFVITISNSYEIKTFIYRQTLFSSPFVIWIYIFTV